MLSTWLSTFGHGIWMQIDEYVDTIWKKVMTMRACTPAFAKTGPSRVTAFSPIASVSRRLLCWISWKTHSTLRLMTS